MDSIVIEIKSGVAIVRLNRPDKLNAFTREMLSALKDAMAEFSSDDRIRAVMITGNGKAFSAGQDLSEVVGAGPGAFEQILGEYYNPIVLAIRETPKPVVAAVNGTAAGAGANLALCCDLILAAESASFIQAFSKIGLIPDSGGTFFLPRLIGWQKALGLAITGDRLSATEAERIGLVYRTYPDGDFFAQTFAVAEKLAAMPTRALALTKQAFNLSMNNTLDDQLHQEGVFQQQAANTEDYAEGVKAFLEKRAPQFTGR